MLLKKTSEHWERVLFSVFGVTCLGYSVVSLFREKLSDASVAFSIGLLAFIFANVAKFKKFKGFGLEAELWEDKRKEAEELIERLRDVVEIYTKEVIIGKVRIGRFVGGGRWKECWKLYDDLIAEHTTLGQSIDFSLLKKQMDDYFLFDMTYPLIDKLSKSIWDGRAKANDIIKKEFGETIRDIEGHKIRNEQLKNASVHFDDAFEVSTRDDLAGLALERWRSSADCLTVNFGVEIKIEREVLEKLECISKVYQNRPVKVTNKLIEWADRQDR